MTDRIDEELQRLRRVLRDVVALSALPSVWTGYDTAQINVQLGEVITRTLDADAVFVRAGGSESTSLGVRTRAEVAGLLRDAADGPLRTDVRVATPGGAELQMLSTALSANANDRIIAASFRSDFPSENDRLLLRVAATQASTLIQRKQTENTLTFLAEASEILSRSLDYQKTLQAISELAVPRFADWCFVDLVESGGSFERIAVAHSDPSDERNAARLKRRYLPGTSASAVARTFAQERTTLVNDVTPSFLAKMPRDEDHREVLLSMNIRCFVSVPMTSRGSTFGVITFLGTKTKTRFEPRDVILFEELAHRAAIAIDNSRLYTEAQHANRAKDEFLANLSHELRTPMTAILGWAHLLQLSDLDPRDLRIGIDTIRQSGQAQAKLIDDLLDVSRIVSGKLHLNVLTLDVAKVAQEAAATIRPAAAAKRQHLNVEIRTRDAIVVGDQSRLQQVFWNLLSNAVKFTPPAGTITMTVEDSEESIVVRVTDTGEGIPAEFIPHVFDRFRQVSKANQRSGLGLGLAIAKELVEMHGGTIRAESEGERRGTMFVVTLPRAPSGAELGEWATDRDHFRLRGMRVLLVEDDETTRTLLMTLLRSFGAEVCATRSSDEAMKNIDSFRAQIVVADIVMPGEDGITLIQNLRANGRTRIPAVAVTGYADEPSRQRALAAGFDSFVTKPVDPSGFAMELERVLRESQG